MFSPIAENIRFEVHALFITIGQLLSRQIKTPSRFLAISLLTFINLIWMIFPSQSTPLKLVALGDSLIAGYGLTQQDSFPSRLAVALKAKHPDLEIINAGVSGDTSMGGLARFDWSVPPNSDALMIGLGGNDLLRAQPPRALYNNLETIIKKAHTRKMKVLLLGMRAPNNYGPAYQKAFDNVYAALAEKYDIAFMPFLLEGVAGQRTLNQPDGIHPNRAGVDIIVRNSLPYVEELLELTKMPKTQKP